MFWYSRILAHHSCVILISIFILSSVCLIVPLSIKTFPDFTDPQLGFEARGTLLSQRIITWKNLFDLSAKEYLIDNPIEYSYVIQKILQNKKVLLSEINPVLLNKDKSKKVKKYKAKLVHNKYDKIGKINILEGLLNSKNKSSYVNNVKNNHHHKLKVLQRNFKPNTNEFFCNVPSSDYARVIISSSDKNFNLWSLEGIIAQCHIDTALRISPQFSLLCQRQLGNKQKCCRSWSPANYIALLSNKTSCLGITELDLLRVGKLLQLCFYFYKNLELTSDCAEDLKCQRKIPATCYTQNAVYYLLHYLLDADFLVNTNNSIISSLNSAVTILPIAASSASLDYYKDISDISLNYKKVYISAMQFGLKNTLFDKLLITDSFFILFGFSFIIICIWSYTGSFLITLSTILAVTFALGISYAIYTLILRIKFFPFMNLLSIIIAIGIGADDAFIYCKVWECNKRKNSLTINCDFTHLIHETMKHSVPSIFITTLTTCIAFFASIISNVTAINCFSLFSGIIVIINFLLMTTWLPASVIVAEHCNIHLFLPENFIMGKIIQPLQIFIDKIILSFTNFLIFIIISLKWFWLLFFFILGIGSCCIVFKFPGLKLQNSQEFQLFDISHLFEQYDLIYTQHFGFEKKKQSDNTDVLPLRFIWGVLPVDNGNYLNPESRGNLVMDNSFNISDQESQVWLQNFCKNLRLQSFYRSTLGPLLPNCFIESLQHWMGRHCKDPINPKIDRSPCCKNSTFPYQPNVLNHCTAEAVAEIHRTPSYLWNFKPSQTFQTAGVKFRQQHKMEYINNTERNSNILALPKIIFEIQVIIVEYDSNFPYSMSFTEINNFFNQVETWMQNQLLTAPHGMKNGWFVSDLEFYELQRTLYEGTIWSIIISILLAFFVLAFITFNPVISLCAILSVGATIIVCISGLVIIGWKLNILESIAISTAIGLAVDFNLHYGMSYRINFANNRIERVKIALEEMSGPTLMAALTTGVTGAFMLHSYILAYIQIGIFLVIIMGVSWIYATFFLCPLLSIIGPSSFKKINYSWFKLPSLNFIRTIMKNENKTETNKSKECMKQRSSTEVSLEMNKTNLNTESEIDCEFLPEFSNAILLNVDIHQTMNNHQVSELCS